MKRLKVLSFFAAIAISGPALAESAAGTWLIGPDQKGQMGHVKMSPCGPSMCGTVIKTFDKAGKQIAGPNDGKRVIWDMKQVAANQFDGKVLLPLYKTTINGKMLVKGNAMTIKGCLGPVCQSQVWKRVN
jgi:uncharacterized protein (DUF2147 family)